MIRAVRFAQRLSLLVAVTALLHGCANKDDAADGGSAATSGDGGVASGDAATGIDCIVEPNTGATLCTAVTSCPSVAVNHDVYPHCGFRLQGSVASSLDLECICTDGYLCPIGVPATCAQATTLLDGQNETTVCTQISEGRCTPPPQDGTGGTSAGTGNTGASSTCDQTCASECVNDPTCLQLCGC